MFLRGHWVVSRPNHGSCFACRKQGKKGGCCVGRTRSRRRDAGRRPRGEMSPEPEDRSLAPDSRRKDDPGPGSEPGPRGKMVQGAVRLRGGRWRSQWAVEAGGRDPHLAHLGSGCWLDGQEAPCPPPQHPPQTPPAPPSTPRLPAVTSRGAFDSLLLTRCSGLPRAESY